MTKVKRQKNFAEVHSDNGFLLQLDNSQFYNKQPWIQINIDKTNKFQAMMDTDASLSFSNYLIVPEAAEIVGMTVKA